MKILFIIFFLLFFSFNGAGQFKIGANIGANMNHLVTTSGLSSTVYRGLPGFTIGIPVIFQVIKIFAVEVNPSFSQKNYRIERNGFFQGEYQNNRNQYIEIPFCVNIGIDEKKFRYFINLGVYGAYWSSSHIKGRLASILNTSDTVTQNATSIFSENNSYSYSQNYTIGSHDNRFEFGWMTGIGVNYASNLRYSFFVEVKYSSSLTDQEKNYQINQVPRYNTTYWLSIGILYNLAR